MDASTASDGAVSVSFCELPGTLQFTASGVVKVPGAMQSDPSLDFLRLPSGFCAHYFGTVGNARNLRFAPGGELFVASPTALTTGGGPNGMGAYVALPDYDGDGRADKTVTFLSFGTSNATNQGMLFAPGYFYYQDGNSPGTKIFRTPYVSGQLSPSGLSQQVADINGFVSSLHWPKPIDMADDGTIYVGNGANQGDPCDPTHPFQGGVLAIDLTGANPNGIQIAKGFRNPISIRCPRGHDHCFALELAKDYTITTGGREKLVLIQKGDDWGFPCCATKGLSYADSPAGTDCSGVNAETNSFYVGETPFSLEFEPGLWSGNWARQAFIAMHGEAGSWAGERIVAIPTDPATGLPLPSTDVNATMTEMGMSDFATGWDDGTRSHGRPAALAFSGDGRLFVANDINGVIFWIAPMKM